jgi:hypothetical protein
LTRRDISNDSEKDCAGCSETACCFVYLVVAFWGFSMRVKKELYVVPLFKSGDKRNFSNYCEIFILSAIPKLFEKLLCDVITPIISTLISDKQHGFLGGRSIVTNLVEFS